MCVYVKKKEIKDLSSGCPPPPPHLWGQQDPLFVALIVPKNRIHQPRGHSPAALRFLEVAVPIDLGGVFLLLRDRCFCNREMNMLTKLSRSGAFRKSVVERSSCLGCQKSMESNPRKTSALISRLKGSPRTKNGPAVLISIMPTENLFWIIVSFVNIELSLKPTVDDGLYPFSSPEEINDSPITAPSKRMGPLAPVYEKPLLSTLAALEIGLDAIRRECPHFRDWLGRLETLSHNRN